MNESINLIRSELKDFMAYRSARSIASSDGLLLNANESPWKNKINGFHQLMNRYPQQQPFEAVSALAKLFCSDTSQILLTRGSDEAIDLIIRLFCKPYEDEIVIFTPTFGMYEISAQLHGIKVNRYSLKSDNNFELNVNEFLQIWQHNQKVLFICSPNNPTGNIIPISSIKQICKNTNGKSVVVLDEAYIDYSNETSILSELNSLPNLIVLRTFSKAFGLAAARLGVAIADKEIINYMRRIMAPYPITSLASEILAQTITKTNLDKIAQQINIIKNEKKRLYDFLSNSKEVVEVWASEANFILVRFKNGDEIYNQALNENIILRNMSHHPQLNNCLRITIGTPAENNKVIAFLYNKRG